MFGSAPASARCRKAPTVDDGPSGETAFEEFPDAENYLEMPVLDSSDGHRYLLTFCRSAAQTPAALREAAERKLSEARGAIHREYSAALWGLRSKPRSSELDDSYEAGVKAALDVVRRLGFPYADTGADDDGGRAPMSEPGEPQRIPLWKHDERAGTPAPPEGWHNPAPLPPGWDASQEPRARVAPRIRPFRGVLKVTAALTAGALLFAFSLYLHGYLKPSAFLGGPAQAPAPAQAPGTSDTSDTGPLIYHTGQDPAGSRAPADANGSVPLTGYPTPGREEASAPLGRPAPMSAKSSAYAFMDKDDSGQPVKYDPCRPIHYVTRAANQPSDGPELIQQAIAAVSRATGLVFIDDGATTEAPSEQREPYQPARYGDRWAPVLIAWETTAEEPRFTNPDEGYTILGIGGSEDVSIGDTDYTYVSGQLKLNAPGLHSIIEDEGTAQARGTIEHELGHLVGLGHVQDPTQLMNPTDSAGLNSYQAGDLNGLAILGQGECRPGI